MANLLVVDDDGHIREVMRFALTKAGHEVMEAADGDSAFELFSRHPFDLLVLDIVMPEQDGLELCRKIRRQSAVPIIFVSSRDEELDRVLGLELGGDDYLTKPFSPRELAARVSAILRRARGRPSDPDADRSPARAELLRHAGVALDLVRHTCTVADSEIVLTVTEFALLGVLLAAPGRVFSRQQLVEGAYGVGHYITDRTVDSHIRRLRQKLSDLAELVETVYGVGYRLRD